MPRFVVLRHDSPQGLHWDFMLEARDTLATWALAQAPDAGGEIAARALPDHRLAYLDFEGEISAGRGSVTPWDRGSFQLRQYEPAQLVAVLAGEKLIGEVALRQSPHDPRQWIFTFMPFA